MGAGKGKRRNGGNTRVAGRKRSPGKERRLGGLEPGAGGGEEQREVGDTA